MFPRRRLRVRCEHAQRPVNDLLWHEVDDLGDGRLRCSAHTSRRKTTRKKTTVTFGNGANGARYPTGTANVKAVYRYGLGKVGTPTPVEISQLATQPLGVQGSHQPARRRLAVPTRTRSIRRAQNAPCAVMALDRLVSVRDYADFSRT